MMAGLGKTVKLALAPSTCVSSEIEAALHQDFLQADRFMLKTMLAHWVMASTIIGLAQGFYLAGFIGGAIITGLAATAYRYLRGTVYSRLIMAVCLMLFSALFIQQSLGRIEFHFHVFGALAFLLRYKDLKPVIIAVITIALHHLIFSYCQQFNMTILGAPIIVFNYGTGLDIVLLHAAFVIFEAIFLGHIIIQLTEQFCQSKGEASENLRILETLRYVISTNDVAARVESSSAGAEVINELLNRMTESITTREAMDKASTALIITDNNSVITDHNMAARNLFDAARDDYKNLGIDFDPDALIGESIDKFIVEHGESVKWPPELDSLEKPSVCDFQVGKKSIHVVVNPVVREHGERLGAIFEWSDRTAEVLIEREVHEMVEAASRGDLSGRVDVPSDGGFLGQLGSDINALVGVAESAIEDAVHVLGSIACGDLTQQIDKDYRGAFGRLKENANATGAKLTELISGFKTETDSIKDSSIEIDQGNEDLSARTQRQSSSLGQFIANMDELTATIQQNSKRASEAATLTVGASDDAQQGCVVVTRAVGAMDKITESSQTIAQIVGVIDEIAFQTNLLALNAAVEAARAGDHGKGFAVVASEVRTLAQRSATAAKEIKQLIDDSLEKVNTGTELVAETGEVLSEIMASVRKVADIVGEISSASDDQTDGVQKAGKAIAEMDEMTQDNADLVIQLTTSSRKLRERASAIHDSLGFFDVSHSEDPDELTPSSDLQAANSEF